MTSATHPPSNTSNCRFADKSERIAAGVISVSIHRVYFCAIPYCLPRVFVAVLCCRCPLRIISRCAALFLCYFTPADACFPKLFPLSFSGEILTTCFVIRKSEQNYIKETEHTNINLRIIVPLYSISFLTVLLYSVFVLL